MKVSGYLSCLALASFAVAPFAAQSADKDSVNACVNAFVADKFADKRTIVRTSDHAIPLPLMARNNPTVKLEAYDAETGRSLASTTCTTKNGTVTVAPVTAPVTQ